MTPVADPFMAGVRPSGLQRGRGGFLRAANDTPWVTHPDGTIVGSGPRKGEPLRVAYGQPSGVGRLIENDVGLTKYKQRNTLLGIGMSPELVEACRELVGMEAGSEEFRKAADTIVVEADNLTRSWLAADRGSHGHLLCELWDRRESYSDYYRAGEQLGLDIATQDETVVMWNRMLLDNGLEVLAIEAACVDDRWRLAGTLDRIVRCTRELRFTTGAGEIVTVPAGTVLVLDIKFGKDRLAYAIQIASYAQSVPYDTETETRGEWPWPIDQTHALIAHGDFGNEERPVSFVLAHVDLVAGREHGGETVVQAKAWAARDDVFSIAQLDVEGVGTRAVPGSAAPQGFDSPPLPSTTPCLAPDPARMALVDARATLTAEPDEGADLAVGFDELWDNLKALFDTLDPAARSWRSEMVSAATRHLVPFHVQSVRTERRYNINRGLIALCLAGGDNDELLRALLSLIVGDVALFPGVHAGHILGSLNAIEAERFAVLVDVFNGPGLAAYIDTDGLFRLEAPAAA